MGRTQQYLRPADKHQKLLLINSSNPHLRSFFQLAASLFPGHKMGHLLTESGNNPAALLLDQLLGLVSRHTAQGAGEENEPQPQSSGRA